MYNMNNRQFNVGDEVVVVANEFYNKHIAKEMFNRFIGRVGVVLARGSGLNIDYYSIKLDDPVERTWLPVELLELNVDLTPETNAVFRDILRGV
jgi:hypothetical protein